MQQHMYEHCKDMLRSLLLIHALAATTLYIQRPLNSDISMHANGVPAKSLTGLCNLNSEDRSFHFKAKPTVKTLPPLANADHMDMLDNHDSLAKLCLQGSN